MIPRGLLVLVLAGLAAGGGLSEAERAKLLAQAQAQNKAGIEHLDQKRSSEAVEPFRRALALYEKLGAEDHPDVLTAKFNLAEALRQSGQLDDVLPLFEQALTGYRKRYPEGHVDLARCLARIGDVHRSAGRYDRALPPQRESLALRRKLHPEGHPDLNSSINNLSGLLVLMGRPMEAIPLLEEGLAAKERQYLRENFPDGHESLAIGLHNLAAAQIATGRYLDALPVLERALAMSRRLYPADRFPAGSRTLAFALQSMGNVYLALDRPAQALAFAEQAVAMCEVLYPSTTHPTGHADFARAIKALAEAWRALGQPEKALQHAQRMLAMREKLYPPARFPAGHPDLATAYNHVGAMLQLMKLPDQALPYHERSLAMFEKVFPAATYPNGHSSLHLALANLAQALAAAGRLEDALPYMERTLALQEKGQTSRSRGAAITRNNLAILLHHLNRNEEAIRQLDQCLAERRKLFPNGHPDLTQSLLNAGTVRVKVGRLDEARSLLEEGLTETVAHVGRTASTLSEADALALAEIVAPGRDALLVATSKDTDPTRAYRAMWPSKAVLTRALQARQLALRAARHASQSVRDQADELFLVRSQLAQMLLEPASATRDEYVPRLSARKERLERALAEALSDGSRGLVLEESGPSRLASALPSGTAFVDLIRYIGVDEKGEMHSCYAAFVVAAGQPVRRVDLRAAADIDARVAAWRKSIAKGTESPEAERLRELVWKPLSALLPKGTSTVYLAPDGDLARLPWAALPGREAGRVLLEEIALAVVPHGPFLLDGLSTRASPPPGPDAVLLLGGLTYDPPGTSLGAGPYPFLDGSMQEVRTIERVLHDRRAVSFTGTAATSSALRAALPGVRYAHFATHGYFAEEQLNEARRHAEQARDRSLLQTARSPESTGEPARSPLLYTGLVLSEANRRDRPGETLLSGEAIVGLPLEGLRLCVLSACETGLGEYTGGEGVQGLQRAFHLAGCPNVVASLWKVSDAATAALMAKFYHELWVNKKPPLEALREAQLAIYRRPDLIPVLAAERGIKLEKAIESATTQVVPAGTPRDKAPTKLWAAFVLSGVGK